MVGGWRRLVVGWTERDFHQLQAQVRSLFGVLERSQLEGRLRHDLQLPQRVRTHLQVVCPVVVVH